MKIVAFILIMALSFALSIWWLNRQPSLNYLWNKYDIDKHDLISFCEKTEWNKPIRQPVNTFSNIIYLIVAISILKKSLAGKQNNATANLITANSGYKVLFGFILLYVFCMSSFYHASLIPVGLRLDYSGVYFISLFPLMYFSPRWSESRMARWRLKQRSFTFLLFSAFLIVWLLLSFLIPSGKLSIATVIIISVCVSVAYAIDKANHSKMNLHYLVLSIFSVVLASLCFGVDRYKVLCNPESYIQPHAFWNLFIGIAALFFYKYMCSENKKKLFTTTG